MKALVYTGERQLEIKDCAHPALGEAHALVKVDYCGICGSDMHAYLGHDERRPAPLILGHEVSGTIVGGENNGQRVTVNPLVTCGSCDVCKHGRTNLCAKRQIISMPPHEGGFAEYITIPYANLVHLPEGANLQSAALAEPLACGWHAVRLGEKTLSKPLSQACCLVLGGGAIGVGAALSLAAFGASDISLLEPNALRRETLKSIGAFKTFDTDEPGLPDLGTVDLIIDGVGYAATRASASAYAKPGGVIVHIGLGQDEGGLDVRRMTLQEITFIGTYTYTAQDFRDTAQAIFDGKLGTLDWVETRPLDDGAAAFEDIRNGRAAAPKIMLTI